MHVRVSTPFRRSVSKWATLRRSATRWQERIVPVRDERGGGRMRGEALRRRRGGRQMSMELVLVLCSTVFSVARTANMQDGNHARLVGGKLGDEGEGEPDEAVVLARHPQDGYPGRRRVVLDCRTRGAYEQ